MGRLFGVKWDCIQRKLNKTYNEYIKPELKYGNEVLVTAEKDKMNALE